MLSSNARNKIYDRLKVELSKTKNKITPDKSIQSPNSVLKVPSISPISPISPVSAALSENQYSENQYSKDEVILFLTIAHKTELVKKALDSVCDNVDTIIIADVANKIDFSHNRLKDIIIKDKPKGLTDSWNIAYRLFDDSNYKYCIISNDDVLFTAGFSVGLIDGLKKYGFDLVGPLVNNNGHQPIQHIKYYVNNILNTNLGAIRNEILKNKSFVDVPYVNGFCFGFKKSIKRFKYSDTNLFNPGHINIGNEDELCRRIKFLKGKIGVCKYSYVYHLKAQSVCATNRNKLWCEI